MATLVMALSARYIHPDPGEPLLTPLERGEELCLNVYLLYLQY